MNYFRWYSVPDSICRGKEKGVTAHHRNPWFSLWWRRGDLNSRPPPCEGDALPAELLPHMDATTRRSEMCMPFTCRGQVFFVNRPSVVRERRACCPWHVRAGQLLSRLRQAEGMLAPVTARMERSSCPPLAPVVSRAFSPWYAGRRAPAFPERLQESMAAPNQAGIATPCPSGHRGIPGPCLPAGKLHATPGKACGIPGGRSFRHPLKKIGRAAPVGAWLPRKKTL